MTREIRFEAVVCKTTSRRLGILGGQFLELSDLIFELIEEIEVQTNFEDLHRLMAAALPLSNVDHLAALTIPHAETMSRANWPNWPEDWTDFCRQKGFRTASDSHVSLEIGFGSEPESWRRIDLVIDPIGEIWNSLSAGRDVWVSDSLLVPILSGSSRLSGITLIGLDRGESKKSQLAMSLLAPYILRQCTFIHHMSSPGSVRASRSSTERASPNVVDVRSRDASGEVLFVSQHTIHDILVRSQKKKTRD